MKISPKLITNVTVLLQIIFALVSIVFAIKHLTAPLPGGEFNALYNASVGVFGSMSLTLSFILMICVYYIFRLKTWAFITSIVLIILNMLILTSARMNAGFVELTPGATISVTSEILPAWVIVMLLATKFINKSIKTKL